jgi:3-deoxy-7-phosphoheptulonate synthase
MDAEDWVPTSWRSKEAAQSVKYPDEAHLNKVLNKVKALPPLVTPSEVRLHHHLVEFAANPPR